MPSTTRRSQRKKQTRLAFTPVPSSSPVKSKYSDSIQSRLANVSYDGASSARKRGVSESTDSTAQELGTNIEDNAEQRKAEDAPKKAHKTLGHNGTGLPSPLRSSQVLNGRRSGCKFSPTFCRSKPTC